MILQNFIPSICTLEKTSLFFRGIPSVCTYICTVHTLERLANNNNNNNRYFKGIGGWL
jgi:hypothetical protein